MVLNQNLVYIGDYEPKQNTETPKRNIMQAGFRKEQDIEERYQNMKRQVDEFTQWFASKGLLQTEQQRKGILQELFNKDQQTKKYLKQ